MTDLIKYNKAKKALAEAKAVDEVLDIKNQAAAMRAYAKQAKDRQLEQDAVEIRLRAERRIGEMMKEQPKAKGGNPTGSNQYVEKRNRSQKNPSSTSITLTEAGIDKNLAKQARKLAKMPQDAFENHVETERTKAALGRRVRSGEFTYKGNEPVDTVEPPKLTSTFVLARARDLKRGITECPDLPGEIRSEVLAILNLCVNKLKGKDNDPQHPERVHPGGLRIIK